jgi:2-amino-4-hydroxy-6-hydroxymethyldihydropteridine diphosphokinase
VSSPNPVRRRAFVALGSNLGDRWANLRTGLAQLPDVVAVSRVYETEPVGGPPGQGRYLNMVAELRTSAAPLELLAAAHRAEALAGRARTVRWGPRTLDVDILLIGALDIDVPGLQVPHPRMWERGFVLVPLADVAPETVGDRIDDNMRASVALAGTLSPVQVTLDENVEQQPRQGPVGQGPVGQGPV